MSRWLEILASGTLIFSIVAGFIIIITMGVTALMETDWPWWRRALYAAPFCLTFIVIFGMIATAGGAE